MRMAFMRLPAAAAGKCLVERTRSYFAPRACGGGSDGGGCSFTVLDWAAESMALPLFGWVRGKRRAPLTSPQCLHARRVIKEEISDENYAAIFDTVRAYGGKDEQLPLYLAASRRDSFNLLSILSSYP